MLRDAQGKLVENSVETKLVMTSPTSLVVCFATQQAGGHQSDDYVALTNWSVAPLTPIPDTTFTTNREDALAPRLNGTRPWVLGTTVLSSPLELLHQRFPPEFTPKRVI